MLPLDVSRCPGSNCPSRINCKRYLDRGKKGDVFPMAAFDSRREAGSDCCENIVPVRVVSTFAAKDDGCNASA